MLLFFMNFVDLVQCELLFVVSEYMEANSTAYLLGSELDEAGSPRLDAIYFNLCKCVIHACIAYVLRGIPLIHCTRKEIAY